MKQRIYLPLTVFVMGACFLLGCSVYTPRTEFKSRIEFQQDSAKDRIEVSDRWWTDLDDPELTQVIETTLNDSLSLRSAWARLDQMQAVARAAGSSRYPSADLQLGVARQELGKGSGSRTGSEGGGVNIRSASLTVGYQVDLWRKISNSHKAAILDHQATRQDLESTALTLTGAAGELWYGIAADQATLQLLVEQIAAGQDFLDLVQLRFANGLASAVEVYQQRLQVESTRNQIPITSTRLATRKHQLAVVLGREPTASTPLPGKGLPVLSPLPTSGIPLHVILSRPDVRAAELKLMAADHRLAVAIANRYPSLTISAAAGGQAESVSNLLDRWFLDLAGNLLAPVFNGGRLAAEADRNQAVVEERFLAWESAVLGACTEIEDALVAERGIRETARILAGQLELAEASLERSRALYVNGLADYLTVLTSLQALQGLQRQAINNHHDLLVNRIRLYLALGASWSQTLQHPNQRSEVSS